MSSSSDLNCQSTPCILLDFPGMDDPCLLSLYHDFASVFDNYQLFLSSSNSDFHPVQYHCQPSTQNEASSTHKGTNLNPLETLKYHRRMQDPFSSLFPLPMSNETDDQVDELQYITKKDMLIQP